MFMGGVRWNPKPYQRSFLLPLLPFLFFFFSGFPPFDGGGCMSQKLAN